jgi:uncharacterized protein YggT (Ycf19 family)
MPGRTMLSTLCAQALALLEKGIPVPGIIDIAAPSTVTIYQIINITAVRLWLWSQQRIHR